MTNTTDRRTTAHKDAVIRARLKAQIEEGRKTLDARWGEDAA